VYSAAVWPEHPDPMITTLRMFSIVSGKRSVQL
jgi:hypothetical protein